MPRGFRLYKRKEVRTESVSAGDTAAQRRDSAATGVLQVQFCKLFIYNILRQCISVDPR